MADNGQITFSLLTKGFKFKLAEMQEHFNDQYIESNKFPRSDFKGNIVNIKDVNLAKDGVYKVTVKGDLNLHGVTKNITANGTIEVKGGKVSAQCQFAIVMKDFNVDAAKVTQKVDLEITCQYE
jgi:polyisoprenoid-binding protein YceI